MTKRTPKRSKLACPAIVGRMYQKEGFSSLALGCHPKQVKEFNERVHKAGCTGIRYDKKGRCQVSDKSDYERLSKSIGLCEEPTAPLAPD